MLNVSTVEEVTQPHMMPIALVDDKHVMWAAIGHGPFVEPFLEIDIANRMPQELFISPIAELERYPDRYGELPLSGLIFHISRCGSTLASQVISSNSVNMVLSEPPILNQMLTRGLDIKNAIRSLSRPDPAGKIERVYIKTSSHNLLSINSYPDGPWLLIIRNPLEVIVSLLKKPPNWISGPVTPLELAAILGKYMQAALCVLPSENAKIIVYPNIVDSISHIGWNCFNNDELLHRSSIESGRHSKTDAPFRSDIVEKNKYATKYIEEAADSIDDLYQALLEFV